MSNESSGNNPPVEDFWAASIWLSTLGVSIQTMFLAGSGHWPSCRKIGQVVYENYGFKGGRGNAEEFLDIFSAIISALNSKLDILARLTEDSQG